MTRHSEWLCDAGHMGGEPAPQPLPLFGAHDAESREGGGRVRGRRRGGEDIRTGAVDQQVDEVRRSRDETAERT